MSRRTPSLTTLARSFTSKMANAPTEALRAWGAQKGLEYLGEGESRAVFALPDGKTVVKFVFSYYGSDANRDEARAWREASPRIRRHLVPVLDVDPEGRWLVMERVTPADVNARTPHAAVDALLACGFADINNRNLSADGRLLDYGIHFWSIWRGDCVALPNPRHNPRETVADRIKRFERYEVRTEESKDYPLFGRGFLALAAQRYSEDEYVRLVAAALELDGRWGLLAEPSAYPAPKGVLLKALKERYAAERTKPITVEVRFRDMWEATAYVGEGRYDRTEVGFVVAAPDYPLACPEEYATLRKAHGDAPTYEVVSSRVHPLMQRKGLGVRLYRALGETLGKERGAYLFANACGSRGDTSAEAQRVYRSLSRDFSAEGLVVYFPPTKANPRNPQTESAAFLRWFGDSKVVDARGKPLVVYHGTAADDFSAFSAGPRSHLGFHFGTAASAEAKLTGDVRRWEPGQARRGGAPTYLTTEDMRVRARDVNRAALATIRAERSRIESGIRERSVPIDLGALLDAHRGDVEAALAEFHLLREERDAKPTPEERRRLDDLDAAERRADDELANLFAFRRPGERVLPVYLSIENPLRMRDTNWGEPAMIKKDHPELRLRGRTLTEIRSEIEGRGYDGIVYENAVEDVGSLSWIAFRPEQIKSATGNRGTFDPADPDIRHNPRRGYTSAMRTDPELWEEVKAEVTRGSKGGLPGQWSARKAQLAVALYKARGGDYYGPKSPYNALAKWTREKWRTKSGRPSLETGERYLPAAAIAALTPAEYAATTRAKRAGMKKGQQFVPQPEAVAKKVRRYRRNPVQDVKDENVHLKGAYGSAEDVFLKMVQEQFAENADLFFGLPEGSAEKTLRTAARRVLRAFGIDPKARAYGIDFLTIEERGKGSGSRIVGEIEQTLRNEGEQVVFLIAAQLFVNVPHSRGFWKRMGYTEVPGNYEPLVWEFGSAVEDDRIMFKVL